MHEFKLESLIEDARNIRVLYVEEHAGTRLKLGNFLKEYFGSVVVERYADNAFKMFENSHFDIIITDANLPDSDVVEFCHKIKKIAPRKDIIIVSKNVNPDQMIELINTGISGYIPTPLNKELIIKVLSRVVLEIVDLKAMYQFQDSLLKNSLDANREQVFLHHTKKEDDSPLKTDAAPAIHDNMALLLKEYDVVSAKEFLATYPVDIQMSIDKLLNINDEIDIYVNALLNQTTQEHIDILADMFENFSLILDNIYEFYNINFITAKLAHIFRNLDPDESYEKYRDIFLAITSGLNTWCDTLFVTQDTPNIHFLDKSLLADALVLENLFRSDDAPSNENDVEFF